MNLPNTIKNGLAAVLAAGMLFSGCASAGGRALAAEESTPAQSSTPVSSRPQESAAPQPQAANAVSVMIPSSHQKLGDLLARLAESQNLTLDVRVGANEPRYTLELLEALNGDDPPSLYWLPGEFSARVLQASGALPYDLSRREGGMTLASLSRMTPAETRVLDTAHVYALPLGLYAEGSVVNLPVLAAMLGTQDLPTLQRDLMECSYQQWRVMQQALADYMEKQGRYQFQLGAGLYTTPSYRPSQAGRLRGIWALSTVGSGSYAQNSLSAVFAAAYTDPADYLDSDPALTNTFLQTPLESLYNEIEFETLHMATEDAALARGETFALRGEITADEARRLFAEGAALLWKADSRQALILEQDEPDLEGKLFIVPTKLPFENENVALLNQLYGAGVDGYLCLSESGAATGAAGGMLVELFTSPAWIKAMETELGLLPFTDLYPQNPLLASLEGAVGIGDYYLLPLSQGSLGAIQGKIADWLNLNLMGKAEWTEADKAAFLTAVQGMIGELTERGGEG